MRCSTFCCQSATACGATASMHHTCTGADGRAHIGSHTSAAARLPMRACRRHACLRSGSRHAASPMSPGPGAHAGACAAPFSNRTHMLPVPLISRGGAAVSMCCGTPTTPVVLLTRLTCQRWPSRPHACICNAARALMVCCGYLVVTYQRAGPCPFNSRRRQRAARDVRDGRRSKRRGAVGKPQSSTQSSQSQSWRQLAHIPSQYSASNRRRLNSAAQIRGVSAVCSCPAHTCNRRESDCPLPAMASNTAAAGGGAPAAAPALAEPMFNQPMFNQPAMPLLSTVLPRTRYRERPEGEVEEVCVSSAGLADERAGCRGQARPQPARSSSAPGSRPAPCRRERPGRMRRRARPCSPPRASPHPMPAPCMLQAVWYATDAPEGTLAAAAPVRVRSVHSKEPAVIRFANESGRPVRALWVDFDGHEVHGHAGASRRGARGGGRQAFAESTCKPRRSWAAILRPSTHTHHHHQCSLPASRPLHHPRRLRTLSSSLAPRACTAPT